MLKYFADIKEKGFEPGRTCFFIINLTSIDKFTFNTVIGVLAKIGETDATILMFELLEVLFFFVFVCQH
jgi:pentatricopeptide repeat protein